MSKEDLALKTVRFRWCQQVAGRSASGTGWGSCGLEEPNLGPPLRARFQPMVRPELSVQA